MNKKRTPLLDDHLIIRVPKQLKESLSRIAESYGHKPTALARHLISVNLPEIARNRFFDYQ